MVHICVLEGMPRVHEGEIDFMNELWLPVYWNVGWFGMRYDLNWTAGHLVLHFFNPFLVNRGYLGRFVAVCLKSFGLSLSFSVLVKFGCL